MPDRISVADRFVYDLGSSTSGEFRCPVTLPQPEDTIFVVAADNHLNRTTVGVAVKTRVDEQVQIQNPLVYPNPLSDGARFVFQLNQAARVGVKVYTISGRPVRTIPEQDCGLGYNQIAWDGRDQAGQMVPNGRYVVSVRTVSRTVRRTFSVMR